MIEACPVCDTLWRLYNRAVGNLQELAGKHSDVRDKGDANSVEILAHELTIAESAIRSVRRELRRHEVSRHQDRKEDQKPESKEAGQNQQNQHEKQRK